MPLATTYATLLVPLVYLAGSTLAVPHVNHDVRHSRGNFGPDLSHRTDFTVLETPALSPRHAAYRPLAAAAKQENALRFLAEHARVSPSALRITSSYESKHNGITHVYVQQYENDVEIVNAVANVNVDSTGAIVSFGESFYRPEKSGSSLWSHFYGSVSNSVSKFTDRVSGKTTLMNLGKRHTDGLMKPNDAVMALAEHLGLGRHHPSSFNMESLAGDDIYLVRDVPFALNAIPVKLRYLQGDHGKGLSLVWDIELEMEDNWYHAQVHAESGKVLQMIDWVADASYNIFPLGINDPLSGDRVTVRDPAHSVASPLGWHDQGSGRKHTDTIGNNVYAHENLAGRSSWTSNHRPDGTSALNFNFPVDLTQDPSTYTDAAITNLFYWNNAIHDLLYVYGFDEASGNFQHHNFGRGGRGGDAVIANAQDGSGYNNANFATTPDGRQPRMRMYVWDVTTPFRDGDLEGGIVMHEYCHGLSTRLTGGPSNSGCLGWGESGGMGEGWGDFFATVTRTTLNSTRDDNFSMGEYANGGNGIRKYKYSTDKAVNPSTYGYIKRPGYWGVHAIGEVWAEILYEVYWDLVDQHGFNPDWFNTQSMDGPPSATFREFATGSIKPRPPRADSRSGNIVALQLVVDGMKLQPCSPSFIDARDAIIQADKINNNGVNYCLLWKAFARRGLGDKARSGGSESFTVPSKCQ
ncbi:Fungalysin metallopeptidase-domain-containing protein [Phlyctochytrium arcticum]|nr:Fungalysin metallopeptidase-domain-containing protein [Phlyctochytrium arcticum]